MTAPVLPLPPLIVSLAWHATWAALALSWIALGCLLAPPRARSLRLGKSGRRVRVDVLTEAEGLRLIEEGRAA